MQRPGLGRLFADRACRVQSLLKERAPRIPQAGQKRDAVYRSHQAQNLGPALGAACPSKHREHGLKVVAEELWRVAMLFGMEGEVVERLLSPSSGVVRLPPLGERRGGAVARAMGLRQPPLFQGLQDGVDVGYTGKSGDVA